jgi:hypothetical protein
MFCHVFLDVCLKVEVNSVCVCVFVRARVCMHARICMYGHCTRNYVIWYGRLPMSCRGVWWLISRSFVYCRGELAAGLKIYTVNKSGDFMK